jgi:hypothetical protein
MRRGTVVPEAWTQVRERICARASVSEFGWTDSDGFESFASVVNASDSASFWCYVGGVEQGEYETPGFCRAR